MKLKKIVGKLVFIVVMSVIVVMGLLLAGLMSLVEWCMELVSGVIDEYDK
jgi:hypothetical protein